MHLKLAGKSEYSLTSPVCGFHWVITFPVYYRSNAIMDRKLFHVNLESGAYKEIPIRFNQEDLRRYEPGFGEISEWLQYACLENAINPLGKFLDGDIAGNLFDRTRQIRAYEKMDNLSSIRQHPYIIVL